MNLWQSQLPKLVLYQAELHSDACKSSQLKIRTPETKTKTARVFGPRRCPPQLLLTMILNVVVHEEFVWMRAQADGVVFLALGADPHINEVFGEDVALE